MKQFLATGIAVLLLCSACTENLSTNRPYILTTATTGGTYYPVGVALATITKAQLYETEGISLSAISSAGSAENIKLMRDNQAQFRVVAGNLRGLGMERRWTNLTATAMAAKYRGAVAERGSFCAVDRTHNRRDDLGYR